jgi:mannan endo-1,4-beta-mannosidase
VWDIQDLDFNWAPYNPGDGYWDVLAMDMYGMGIPPRSMRLFCSSPWTNRSPSASANIAYCAGVGRAAPLDFFMAWAELVFSDNGTVTNSVQQIKDLYAAAAVMTRDQMPGWG